MSSVRVNYTKMTGPLIAFAVIGPVAGLIALYRLFNRGEEPCMKINLTRIFVSESN